MDIVSAAIKGLAVPTGGLAAEAPDIHEEAYDFTLITSFKSPVLLSRFGKP
jgi:hypothetical protein